MTKSMKSNSALEARMRVIERKLNEVLRRTGMDAMDIIDLEFEELVQHAARTGDHGPVMELMQKRSVCQMQEIDS